MLIFLQSKNFNPFTDNALSKVEGWTTTADQGKDLKIIYPLNPYHFSIENAGFNYDDDEEEPNFESYELENHNLAHREDDVISKDSLEEDTPVEESKKPDEQEVELVYNSMLGLYYDPKTKQHYDVKPDQTS